MRMEGAGRTIAQNAARCAVHGFCALIRVLIAVAGAAEPEAAHAELNVGLSNVTLRLSTEPTSTTIPATDCAAIQAGVKAWRRAQSPDVVLVFHAEGDAVYQTVLCALGGWGAGGDPHTETRYANRGGPLLLTTTEDSAYLTVVGMTDATAILSNLTDVGPVEIPNVVGAVDAPGLTNALAANLEKRHFDVLLIVGLTAPWSRMTKLMDATCDALADARTTGSQPCRFGLNYGMKPGDPGLPAP